MPDYMHQRVNTLSQLQVKWSFTNAETHHCLERRRHEEIGTLR